MINGTILRRRWLFFVWILCFFLSGCLMKPLTDTQELERHARRFEIDLPSSYKLLNAQKPIDIAMGDGLWRFDLQCTESDDSSSFPDMTLGIPASSRTKVLNIMRSFADSGLYPEDLPEDENVVLRFIDDGDDGAMILHQPGQSLWILLVWYS